MSVLLLTNATKLSPYILVNCYVLIIIVVVVVVVIPIPIPILILLK